MLRQLHTAITSPAAHVSLLKLKSQNSILSCYQETIKCTVLSPEGISTVCYNMYILKTPSFQRT